MMSRDLDPRTRRSGKATLVSLVAVIGCVLADDAVANPSQTEPAARERALPARVAAIAERLRSSDPTLLPALPPETSVAQWRNF